MFNWNDLMLKYWFEILFFVTIILFIVAIVRLVLIYVYGIFKKLAGFTKWILLVAYKEELVDYDMLSGTGGSPV